MKSSILQRSWKLEEVVSASDLFFSRLIADIDQASVSIDLETYIFTPDATGRSISEALVRAAGRGLRVRVMVDGFGSPHWSSMASVLQTQGVFCKVYHPLPFKLNRRNHRKTCIVDSCTAWVGSINITSDHLDWNDCAVRVQGHGISELEWSFEKSWSGRSLLSRRPLYSGLVRLNDTYFARRRVNADLVMRVKRAVKCVWFESAYFVPSPHLVRALRQAARRDVDVRVIVPGQTDVFFMRWIASAYYYGLIRAGVKVFEYMPRVLHSKIAVIDDWCVVGTSNLNHRSLLHDLEVDVVLRSSRSRQTLEDKLSRDLNESAAITLIEWERRGFVEKLLGRLLYWIRFWM